MADTRSSQGRVEAAVDSVQFYPEWLERFWVRRIGDLFPAEPLDWAVAQMEEPVRRLSDLFTLDRPTTYKDYGDAEATLLAYGLYFFPQTWARVRFPIKELVEVRGWRPPMEGAVRILDLGSGMGAAGFSAAQLLQGMGYSQSARLVSIDHSGAALGFQHGLSELLSQHEVKLDMRTRRGDFRKRDVLPKPKQHSFDLILLSFSLNEAFTGCHEKKIAGWLRKLAPLLEDDGILLIVEPALKITAEKLAATQERLLKSGFHSWGPYLHNGSDPMLDDRQFWSHEVRAWSPPPSLARVNRELWRSIEDLKFSTIALSKKPPPPREPNPLQVRLVSPVARVKGLLKWAGIDNTGTRRNFEFQTRGYDRSELTALLRIQRGDLLEFSAAETVGDPPIFRITDPRDLEWHYAPE
ncbi:MAG: small ribosomal subunit Rsm22 family protein [Verrucomicrobiota bacterium]